MVFHFLDGGRGEIRQSGRLIISSPLAVRSNFQCGQNVIHSVGEQTPYSCCRDFLLTIGRQASYIFI